MAEKGTVTSRRAASQATDIALIKQDVGYIKSQVDTLTKTIQSNYVPLSDFNALKDRVNLLYKAVFFLMGTTTVVIIGAFFKEILKP